MSIDRHSELGRHRLILLDVGLALWVLVWAGLAVAIGRDIAGLTGLATTIVRAGEAVEETGRALRALEAVPLVGERLGRVGRRLDTAGRNAVASGRESRRSLQRLSVLLAVAVGVIPAVPLLAVYVPFRLALVRGHREARGKEGRDTEEPWRDRPGPRKSDRERG